MSEQFEWVQFYEALANKLFDYKDDKKALMDIMKNLHEEEPLLKYLNFNRKDWWEANNNEIDPFSIFGTFNRGLTKKNRMHIAGRYAEIFHIELPAPKEFKGIPILNNMNSFYSNPDGVLWELFIEALEYAKSTEPTENFKEAFNKALSAKGNGLSSLTMGLFWIRPNFFINLDSTNQQFFSTHYNISLKRPNFNADSYIELLKTIKEKEPDLTIPEISSQAWDDISAAAYTPGLSGDDWLELLNDPAVFNKQSLEIMKRLKDYGGKATCTQLANKYGEKKNFYNRGSSALAERIYNKTKCKTFTQNGKSRWWRILYTGTDAAKEDEGSFIWELRKELSEALNRIDLSNVRLYTDELPTMQPKNYWWINASPTIWEFSTLREGETVDYSLVTENNRKRRIYQNFIDAKIGDPVICYETNPVKQIVALGEIAKEQDGEILVVKKNEELMNPIDYHTLKESKELSQLEFFTNPNGTLFKVTPTEYEFIMDAIRQENQDPFKAIFNEPYSKEDFLKDVYLTEENYNTIIGLLEHKKNLILQGAPGVGKTYAAKRIAWSILGEKDDSRIETIQFHQNYSYEDFIMGYKPHGNNFELQDGIFVNFCRSAANDPDNKYFLIIDEINRGNMSKIFGELLMLIENDYRGEKIRLPYSGQLFSVPHNLYIIGMMNTADRSLAMIDYALRRRFSFFEMEPAFDSQGYRAYQNSLNNERFNILISRIQHLNSEIEIDQTLGKGFCIGHSYFTGQKSYTDDWINRVIEYDILPMLKEYWFDEEEKVHHWESTLRGVFND